MEAASQLSIEHHPVLLDEVRRLFQAVVTPATVVDCTVGLGGHASALLQDGGSRIERFIGLDRDRSALSIARERLEPLGRDRVHLYHSAYNELEEVLDANQVEQIDFALLDLGVSTLQLKTPHRGFAFMLDGPLDMRMDTTRGPTARLLLQRASQDQIETWLREYGEVRYAGRIARKIFERRGSLATTRDLVQVVLDAQPGFARSRKRRSEIHPATLVFQALRIAVNQELEQLDSTLPLLLDRLNPGGRLAVIAFHSLEDRRVKRLFETYSRDCICPPRIPICGCNHRARVKLLTRKPLQASDEEVARNAPSRSARLRAAEALP